MANRLEFEVSVNAAGFKRGMMEIEASANATNARLQNLLKAKITGVEARMAGMNPNSWEYVQANQRKLTLEKSLLNTQNALYLRGAMDRKAIAAKELEEDKAIWAKGQQEWRTIQAAQTATMLANFEKQRIAAAALKADQLSMLATVARGYGAGVSSGVHGQGGLTGIIRESLVIVRELSMGRGLGRVAGSVTLLAQYMGLLGKLVKSSATGALLASAAETKLSQSMAATAIAAEAKAAASLEAARAETVDTAAMERLAAADQASAVAARNAAVGQEAKSAAAAQAAETALAGATVAIGPIGWLTIGVVALVAVLAALAFHWHKLSVQAKNLSEMMNPLNRHFTEEAEAALKAAKAHEELQHWLEKELNNRKEMVEIIDLQLEQLKREAEAQRELARAKGESMSAINAMEVSELKTEQALLQTARDKAQADLDAAKAALAAADAAAQHAPEENGVTLKGAERVAKNAGDILDAVQDQISEGAIDQLQIAKRKYGGDRTISDPATGHGQVGLSASEAVTAGLNGVTGNMTIDQAIAAMTKSLMAQQRTVTVGGKSVSISGNDAKANFDDANALAQRLQKAQEDLAEALENAKGDVHASNEAFKKFNSQLDQVNAELKIKTGIGAQTAALDDAKNAMKRGIPGGDSLVRVGNFLGTAKSGIESLAEEHIKIARESLGHLRSMDGKMGVGGGTHFSGI